MMKLAVLQPEDVLAFAVTLALGHATPDTRMLLSAAIDFVGRVGNAPPREAVLCACCTRHLARVPFSLAVAMPARDDGTRGIAMGICQRCAAGPAETTAKAMQALRKIFPEARPMQTPCHVAGHA